MSNFDEIKSLNLFGGNEGENKNEEAIGGEMIGTVDAKGKPLDSILEMLSQMRDPSTDDADDDFDNDDNVMDADDYHNKACDMARRGNYKRASNFCMEGLKRYPMNVNLLADTINYSSKCGDMRVADTHYFMLRKLPFSRWSWRAFTFSCDYLLASNPIENEEEIRLLVKQYKTVLPYDEKACVAESELENALGNHEQSMKILTESIQHYSNASVCALHLADMQFERGMYEDVVKTCNYGIAASAEPWPSINTPYLLLLRAMSKDQILITKANREIVTASEANAIRDEYKLLLEEFPHQMMLYSRAIKERRSILKFVSHEE